MRTMMIWLTVLLCRVAAGSAGSAGEQGVQGSIPAPGPETAESVAVTADLVLEVPDPVEDGDPAEAAVDCEAVPEALRHLVEGCAPEDGPVDVEACVTGAAAGETLSAPCARLLACYEDFPTASCLSEFPLMLSVQDGCARAAGVDLVCLYREDRTKIAMAIGYEQSTEVPAEEPESGRRRREILAIGGFTFGFGDRASEKSKAAAELLGAEEGRGDRGPETVWVNRSMEGAVDVFVWLLDQLGESGVRLYFVNGSTIEDEAGRPVVRVRVPKNGGTCAVSVENRFAGERGPAREARHSMALRRMAPNMGLRRCTEFVLKR